MKHQNPGTRRTERRIEHASRTKYRPRRRANVDAQVARILAGYQVVVADYERGDISEEVRDRLIRRLSY